MIIPTYNRASLITSAIKSVIYQTYQDYEIIVIDDGSTDDTPEVLAAYCNKLQYVRLPHSGNPATARNAGLSIAVGEYVAFLDSDDEWLPNKLERQVQILNSNPEIGLICSNALVRNHGREELGNLYLHPDQGFSGSVLPKLLEQNFIIASSAVIRRDILEKTGSFCELSELIAIEDYDLWLRIASLSNIHFIPEALAIYTKHSGSNLRSTRKLSQHWQGHLIILRRLEKYLKKNHLPHDIKPINLSIFELRYKKSLVKALWNERQSMKAIVIGLNALISHPRQVARWLISKAVTIKFRVKVDTPKSSNNSEDSISNQQGKLRLHLGCGEIYIPGFVNIDFPPDQHTVQTTTRADLYADITKLVYPPRSVKQIRLHHVFEHFNRPTALRLLIDWYGWLEDGGLLVIETPDFERSAKVFLKGNTKNRQKALRHVFGSHEAIWATHQDGWYKEKYNLYLTSLGYHEIKFLHTEWNGTYNITVEARVCTPLMKRSEQFRAAENLLRHSLIDESLSEQRLLQTWLDELKSLNKY